MQQQQGFFILDAMINMIFCDPQITMEPLPSDEPVENNLRVKVDQPNIEQQVAHQLVENEQTVITQTQTNLPLIEETRQHTTQKPICQTMKKNLAKLGRKNKIFKGLLRQASAGYTNSSPLRMIELAIKCGYLHALQERFQQQVKEKIQKITATYINSRPKRVQMTQLWKKRIQDAMRSQNFQERFDIIWQQNNHPSVCNRSFLNVKEFVKKLDLYKASQLTD